MTIQFAETFLDLNGQPTNPASAMLYITYPIAGNATETISIAMTQSDPLSPWTAIWESEVAQPGTVLWSIKTGGGSPYAATDGNFTIGANAANLMSA